MSKSVDLADAIVGLLNNEEPDAGWILQFEAERAIAPLSSAELESLNTVRVLVFNGPTKAERVTRSRFKRTYKTTVAIHRRLGQGATEANVSMADQLVELAEQFGEQLESSDFPNFGLSFLAFNEEQDNDLYSAEVLQVADLFVHAILLEHTTG